MRLQLPRDHPPTSAYLCGVLPTSFTCQAAAACEYCRVSHHNLVQNAPPSRRDQLIWKPHKTRQYPSSPSPTSGSTDGSKYSMARHQACRGPVEELGCRQGLHGNGKGTLYYYNIERWIRVTILKVRMMPALLVACAPDIASNQLIGCSAR